MSTQARQIVRLLAAAGVLACIALVAWAVWPKSVPPPAWAGDYDVSARPPETIAPGVVIGRSAPEGWSHLVLKSLPRVRPSEVANVPNNLLIGRDGSVRMAAWMFTAIVADVRAELHGGVHRLRAVALGLGTSTGGGDIIITPETAGRYGVELSWITREILTKGYETQGRAMTVVHGPTFALLDAPVWYRCGDKHRLVRFRYALFVDAPTGRLDVGVWLLDTEGDCADGAVCVLAPNTVDEVELVPDPREFNAVGIPSDAAFAVDRLPAHRARVLLPPDLRTLAMQAKYTPAEAGTLEEGIRRLLALEKP